MPARQSVGHALPPRATTRYEDHRWRSAAGVDRVVVTSAFELERKKTLKACRQAQCYRNLAEQMRKENRDLANSYKEKLKLVRDFWRNNIKEGSTRARKIALQRHHSTVTS